MNINVFEYHYLIIASVIVAFFVSYITIPTIIRMAHHKNLFDEIDERKVHSEKIPRLGGIGFFSGMLISIMLFVDSSTFLGFGGFLSGLFILFLIGLKDDILVIAPLTKLIGQILASVVVIIFSGAMITDFHGFFGIHEIPWVVGFVLTIFVFLVTINAFNFIDGIDGLASSIGVITSSAFGLWFILIDDYNFATIAFTLAAALIAFIRFNVFSKKSKIFMGDTGSMVIGFVVSFLAVQFNELNLGLEGNKFYILPAPAVTFGILIIPYFDLFRVMYIRLLKGQKIFKPDQNHLHHLFLKLGLSHRMVVQILMVFNVLFIVASFYLSSFVTIRRLILLQLIFALAFSFIPESILKKRNEKKAKKDN